MGAFSSSGFQLCPIETRHLTRGYTSNKFATGCRLALHLGNTIPRNFQSMTPSGPVISLSNRRRSSANAVDDLFSHQCCGTLSHFGVGCAATANTFKSLFLLRFTPDRECTSDSCLKFSVRNCGWEIRLKSIGLACVFDCAIVLRLLLITLRMFQLIASKLSSACSRLIQIFSYLLHYT